MHYSVLMAINKTREQLVHQGSDLKGRARSAESVHVFCKITVKKLKNKVKFFFGMNDISQLYNVGMSELLEHADLSECSFWHPLVLVFDSNLFYCYDLLRGCVHGLKHGSIRACTKLLVENKSEVLRFHFNIVAVLMTLAHCYLLLIPHTVQAVCKDVSVHVLLSLINYQIG